jgi:hypothetical protein
MKIILFAGCALACVALSGCAGFTVPGLTSSATAANSALVQFLSDPNCAHHDEANLVTGAAGMPASFNAKIMRDCPAHPVAPAPVVAPVVAPAVSTPVG